MITNVKIRNSMIITKKCCCYTDWSKDITFDENFKYIALGTNDFIIGGLTVGVLVVVFLKNTFMGCIR